MSGHILAFPYVIRKSRKLSSHGYGKHRAWCDQCHSLKPKTDFWQVLFYPHPDSETGMYYEPHLEAMCSSCYHKRKDQKMTKREYWKRFRATTRAMFAEGHP